MKNIVLLMLCIVLSNNSTAQTMHSIIFADKEEQGRENDRTSEMNQMINFCNSIAETLEFNHDLHAHSGIEFTSTTLEEDISMLEVNKGDIVLFYYAGHGCNWDDDEWPHMAFRDKQYWESTAFSKLKSSCGNAKLIMCISSCCNMDTEGRMKEKQTYSKLDKTKAHKLFGGFNGKKTIIASSSIRGQYSYSWSSGQTLGSVYTISLRKTIIDALLSDSNLELTWENIFDKTAQKTLLYTNNKQLPQYKIENDNHRNIEILVPSNSSSKRPEASVDDITLVSNVIYDNVSYMEIQVKFRTHYMDEDGGRVVALFEDSSRNSLKDTNNKFCTVDGQISVGNDFGTHYEHASFPKEKLLIPLSEIHETRNGYIRIGIYDYKTKKYIHFSNRVFFHF